MATSTFDRELVLTKEEDIERFWKHMNSEPKPLPRHKDFRMEDVEWGDLLNRVEF